MPIRSHVRPVVILLSSLWLAACGGGGGGFIEVPEEPSNPPEASYSISGSLSIAAGISVDGDINDIFAPHNSNSIPTSAQVITNNALVHGFASAVGTGGSTQEERFALTADRDDYYRVALQSGQTVRLQVVDVASGGDLDLKLLDNNNATIISSDTTSEFEQVTAPADGEYLINVFAFDGVSKYVLQILPASGTAVAKPADFVPGEVVVQYLPAVGIASRSSAADPGPQRITLERNARIASAATDPLEAFNPVLYEKRRTLIEAKRLSQQDGVKWAEPNYIVQPTRIPDDSLYVRQWHYPAINLPQAWDITIGDVEAPREPVIVAVIDTGVYRAHSDFTGQLVPGYDFISSTSISRDGNGIDSNPDDPGDSDTPGASSWHGTHVAGTVAAATNNSGTGVAGTSWGAKIMPLRALGKGGGTTYDVAQSIRFAARLSNDSNTLPPRKADIINLSLGSSQATNAERDAVAAAIAAGVIIVAAAGNENVSTPFYPAAYEGVIGVSASTIMGEKAYYSNFGNYIDIAAPGGDLTAGQNLGILSTYVDGYQSGSTDTRRSTYDFLQGTSMAAPHVAGVIALMKAVHPDLTGDQVTALISECKITSKNGGTCTRDNNLGYGIIDAYLAVTEALALANNSTSIPAIVQSDKTQLTFSTLTTPLDFVLSNIGDNEVTDLTAAVTAGSSWLSVAEQSVDGVTKLGTYRATVDRTGLLEGVYNGTITVTYADATAQATTKTLLINVSMQVGTITTAGVMTQQYVLLENADCTSDNCIVRTVFASANGSYSFTNVPAGNYRVFAGSDIDVDGLICGAGETCGAYPSLGAEQIIRITDRNVSGRDFLLNLNGTGGVASSGTLQIQNLQPAGQPGKAR